MAPATGNSTISASHFVFSDIVLNSWLCTLITASMYKNTRMAVIARTKYSISNRIMISYNLSLKIEGTNSVYQGEDAFGCSCLSIRPKKRAHGFQYYTHGVIHLLRSLRKSGSRMFTRSRISFYPLLPECLLILFPENPLPVLSCELNRMRKSKAPATGKRIIIANHLAFSEKVLSFILFSLTIAKTYKRTARIMTPLITYSI